MGHFRTISVLKQLVMKRLKLFSEVAKVNGNSRGAPKGPRKGKVNKTNRRGQSSPDGKFLGMFWNWTFCNKIFGNFEVLGSGVSCLAADRSRGFALHFAIMQKIISVYLTREVLEVSFFQTTQKLRPGTFECVHS